MGKDEDDGQGRAGVSREFHKQEAVDQLPHGYEMG